MPYIRETILTTVDAAGAVHIAPLGIIAEGEFWIIAPFRPSKTLDNLVATGMAIANLTDDPLIFAGCLTGRKDWPLLPVEGCPVPRLEAALAHDVLTVEDVAEDATRPRFRCRVSASATHAPFTGLNRARAAILEAAILVSRLHMLPAEKIEAEIAYLNIAIEKTAGDRERQAWYWLMERIIAHLATLEA
ncbi:MULTISPECIES: DUF447 domain-containing protein [unclassified Aureimonas]|uniref:DUF447 domain-containing protein n=1 Tax=unclassified Aureimonas TaxID=2615206 RepID=UPI0006F95109|nr:MULTISPECIES: DUF447 domain-containing protein [unclassified Aureimonas]KQT70008.1 tetrahydromethanopterin synthesis protein [Aureimonas sp. Leaf427]KQT75837.1 tetrahydromethanopterin synthesis protein [Aureimonas sp. Leaf460]